MRLFLIALSTCLSLGVCNRGYGWVPHLEGDVNGDGSVDNVDFVEVLGHFGHSSTNGDVDGNGNVEAADFAYVKANFVSELVGGNGYSGPLTFDPNPALLLYNPLSGVITLDQSNAPGGIITSFVLSTALSFTSPASATFPFPGSLTTATSSVISQTDDRISLPSISAPGFATDTHSLGALLPTGLSLVGLNGMLSSAVYVGTPGTGVRSFNLAVVPEAGSWLMISAVAAVGLGCQWLKRCRRCIAQ